MKTVTLDTYVIETLLPDLVGHDRKPSAFLVYLHLWVRGAAARGRRVRASYSQIAADTGLAKASVQGAVRHLKKRRLLAVEHANATAVPVYTVLKPWVRGR